MKMFKIEKYKKYNSKLFKKYANIYDYIDLIIGHVRKKTANKVNGRNLKIIDVACGTGSQSIAFAKKGFEVTGIDLSKDMLKIAKNKIKPNYNLKFIYTDASSIPFKNSEFDVASISLSLHDMPEKIGLKVLIEMKRVTKKNGKILIIDYHRPNNKFIAMFFNKLFSIWESKYYQSFMKMGINYYLKKVKLDCKSKGLYFFKNIQIVECINKKQYNNYLHER